MSAEIPKFKKGTVVTLSEFGEVLEGVLAEDANLPYETGKSLEAVKQTYTPVPFYVFTYTDTPNPNRVLSFRGGTKVTFNDKGEVVRGTLSGSNGSIALNQTNRIAVSDAEVSFHKNGMVETCTLASDSYLRPVSWAQILTENYTRDAECAGFVEFKAGKPITLNEKGEVVKGTLKKNTKLLTLNSVSQSIKSLLSADGTLSQGIKVYEAGTVVEFDDKGLVVKAVK